MLQSRFTPSSDLHLTFRPLVEEANADPEVVFTKFKADMVERLFVKCMRGHMASDSCEVCEAIARTKVKTARYPKGKKGTHWEYPRTTRGRLRTHASFTEIAT